MTKRLSRNEACLDMRLARLLTGGVHDREEFDKPCRQQERNPAAGNYLRDFRWCSHPGADRATARAIPSTKSDLKRLCPSAGVTAITNGSSKGLLNPISASVRTRLNRFGALIAREHAASFLQRWVTPIIVWSETRWSASTTPISHRAWDGIKTLVNDEWGIQAQGAIWIMGETRDRRFFSSLAALLCDPDEKVRAAAFRTIAKLKHGPLVSQVSSETSVDQTEMEVAT